MKKLLLIDANSIIHRSFHALPNFTAPDGTPTGALYGVASIILKLWKDDRPDFVAALFDRPEPTFREKKFIEYKAQRPATQSILISQLIETHNLFDAFGISFFEKAGYEADDLIATLATKFKDEEDLQIVILTGDRDTLQLISDDKIVVETFNKGVSNTTIYDEKRVMEKYGLPPRAIVDYKALAGDPSDNIKGVPGIGPKTAINILKKYGSVENIYKNIDSDPSLKNKLGKFKKEAEFSKELVLLEKNVPIDNIKLSSLKSDYNREKILSYFKEKNFTALIKRFDVYENERLEESKHKSVQGKMF
jgi:DNA polymerase-1